MRVVIAGCGRMGSLVAAKLAEAGHDVTMIDVVREAFTRLPAEFHGRQVLGTAIDVDVLRDAGLGEADVFLALTRGDNTNAVSAQLAERMFSTPTVLARITDPERAEVFKKLGLKTFCPTIRNGEYLLELLNEQGR